MKKLRVLLRNYNDGNLFELTKYQTERHEHVVMDDLGDPRREKQVYLTCPSYHNLDTWPILPPKMTTSTSL